MNFVVNMKYLDKVNQMEIEMRNDWEFMTDEGRDMWENIDKYVIAHLKKELSNELENIDNIFKIVDR